MVLGVLVVGTPAEASGPPFALTLTAEKYSAASNEPVELFAVPDHRVDQPYYIQVWNETRGVKVGHCTNTTAGCSPTVTEEIGTYEFVAYVTYNDFTTKSNIVATSNPVFVTWSPLGGGTPDPSFPSQSCEQTPGHISLVEDLDVQGTHIDLTAVVSPSAIHVCYRVDAYTVHLGGRLNILAGGSPSVSGISVGVPFTDANTTPCGGPGANAVPGQHPMVSGLVGGQLLVVDTYVNTAWGASVCIAYGNTKIRAVVPFVIGSPTINPGLIIPSLDQDPPL